MAGPRLPKPQVASSIPAGGLCKSALYQGTLRGRKLSASAPCPDRSELQRREGPPFAAIGRRLGGESLRGRPGAVPAAFVREHVTCHHARILAGPTGMLTANRTEERLLGTSRRQAPG